MSVWSVEAVKEFIRLFRENTCLWMVKSRDYTNRNKRNEAYDVLVKFCRTIGFTSANREFVTKKIQNLRGAFRKELNKVIKARSSQEVYQPSLWYYDLLLFIGDQEESTPNVCDITEDDSIDAESEVPETSYRTPPRHTTVTPPPIRHVTPNSDHITVEVPARALKRKFKPNVTDSQFLWKRKFMNVCTEAIKNKKELTEYEALSITIGKKLEKMDYIQALHAETIIHTVLRKGLLNQLTESTDICDKQCNKIVLSTSNMPRPSSSSVNPEGAYHSSLMPKLEIQDDPLSD